MIVVSEELKSAFSGADLKQLVLTFDDGTVIDNEDIALESMELEQSICEEDELQFGKIASACFKTKIKGTTKQYKNLWFNATLKVGTHELPLGRFCVYSDSATSDRMYRDIVAYDTLFWAINTDVSEWYNGLTFPISLKTFRDSFFAFIGIEQEETELPNDSFMISKTIDGSGITGLKVMQAICQINARFGCINNAGLFRYVRLRTSEHDAVYPSETLYPSEDLYPNDIYDDYVSKSDYYFGSLKYEEFDVKPISQVIIREESNDLGVTVGLDGNTYIIQDNFLLYGSAESELKVVAQNFLDYAQFLTYTPSSLSCKGAPWREVGDLLEIMSDTSVINLPILNRVLSGITALKDTYTARGKEIYEPKENDVLTDVTKLKSKTNKLTRTLDETRSEISGLETEIKDNYTTKTEVSTLVSQTAENINVNLNKRIEETEQYASNVANTAESNANTSTDNKLKSYSTTSEMNAAINLSAESVTLEVNKTIQETAENLQKQIDNTIETYTGSEVPTLNNYPAVEWTTDEIKDTHLRDLYVVSSENEEYGGFYYRFEKLNGSYQWVLLKNNEVAKALEEARLANEKAQAVADNLATNYSTTTQMNSAIQQTANSITTRVDSQIEETREYSQGLASDAQDNAISVSSTDATNKANKALSDAKADTNEKLLKYSTTEEMNTAIEQKANSITLSVDSKITETKTYAQSVANTAESNAILSANSSTDEKLKLYSTTEQVQSSIKLESDSILSSVSQSYETKTSANSKYNSLSSRILQNAEQINLRVEKGSVISEINQTSEEVKINASRISLEGIVTANEYFKILTDGSFVATSGKIGGINVNSNGIYYSGSSSTDGFGLWRANYHALGGKYIIFHAGGNNGNIGGAPFIIYQDGSFKSSNADIQGNVTVSGTLHAGEGSSLGGFETDNNSLFSGTWTSTKTPTVFMCTGSTGTHTLGGHTGTNWCFGAGTGFGVTKSGALYCNSGQIGNWKIVTSTGSLIGQSNYTSLELHPNGKTESGKVWFVIIRSTSGNVISGLTVNGFETP